MILCNDKDYRCLEVLSEASCELVKAMRKGPRVGGQITEEASKLLTVAAWLHDRALRCPVCRFLVEAESK